MFRTSSTGRELQNANQVLATWSAFSFAVVRVKALATEFNQCEEKKTQILFFHLIVGHRVEVLCNGD